MFAATLRCHVVAIGLEKVAKLDDIVLTLKCGL